MPYYERQHDEAWSDYHGIKDRHCHPDVGSFQVYAHGKWLATEPGYAKPKYTYDHCTILADELEASPSSNYFEWRLRTTHKRAEFVDNMNISKQNDDYYIIENNNDSDVVVMDAHFVHPGLVNFSTGTIGGTEFLKANFDSTSGGDMLATILHPRRDEEPASSITSSSFVDSVLYLTIEIGAETINVELDLSAQEVTIY